MPSIEAHLASILMADSGVDPGYRHGAKYYHSGEPLQTQAALFKWYELHPSGAPVPPEISALARHHVAASSDNAAGLGFVILHRCGGEFYFLIACTWRNSNEIWETVFYKNGEVMKEFAVFPRDSTHLPTFCVWELAPVLHEKAAWERFLRSSRDSAAAQAWLADRASGEA